MVNVSRFSHLGLAIATLGIIGSADALAQRQLRGSALTLDDNGSATNNTVTLQTPVDASLTGNYTLTLPTSLPTVGGVGLLQADASGQLSFFTSSNAQNNYFLTIVNGTPTYTDPATLTTLWSTSGNTGLIDGVSNYFGTSDNVGINFITAGTGNVRMAIGADGTIALNGPVNLNGVAVPLTMNGNAGLNNQVLVSRGPGLTPEWSDIGSLANAWTLGGNSAPSSTLLGNNAVNGDLDLRAGNATRVNIDGATGLTTVNNGLAVTGPAPADNVVTVGSTTTGGAVAINDGSGQVATVSPANLQANHTYLLPDLGAAPATASIPAVDGTGNTGQALISRGAGLPAEWRTVAALGLTAGIADPTDGSLTVVVNPGVALTPTSVIQITHISNIGGGAYVSTITTGLAGASSFTVTMPGPAGATERIHWTVIP